MKLLLTTCSLLMLCQGGCPVDEPDFPPPDETPVGNVSYFADVVLGIGDGDLVTACVSGIPLCGSTPQPQPGPCANNPALGPPDGRFFDIPPLGRLELGFLCNFIREVGGNVVSDDLRVHGSATANAQPIVEVSADGTHYVPVNLWSPAAGGGFRKDPGFELEVPHLDVARYVRISEVSGVGSIQIDAIEALPMMTAP